MADELEQPAQAQGAGASGPPEPPAPPVEGESRPEKNPNFKWYILHAYSGFERKVRESIASLSLIHI